MKIKKLLLSICFVSYFVFLLYLLFFSAYRQSVEGEIAYNLIPFRTIAAYFHSFDGFSLTDQFVGNMLAFVPFGYFLPYLFKGLNSFHRVLLWSLVLTLSVEVSQFLFRVGAFDVDDLLLNTIGGELGYLLFWIEKKSRLNSK